MKIIWSETEDKELLLLWESDIPVAKLFMQSKTNRQMRGRANQLGLKRHKRCVSKANIHKNKNVTGRDLSIENLKDISRRYKTKSQFRLEDPSAYTTASKLGILDTACAHLSTGISFNYPQTALYEIIKLLFENISVSYNDRKAIYPKELDVYVQDLNVAFEYDGSNFHNKLTDEIKNNLCVSKQIKLYRIIEDTSKKNEPIINILNQLNEYGFNTENIDPGLIKEKITKHYMNIEDIEAVIKKYSSSTIFKRENAKLYEFIKKNELIYLLDAILVRRKLSEDEIMKMIDKCDCKNDVISKYKGAYLQLFRNKQKFATAFEMYNRL